MAKGRKADFTDDRKINIIDIGRLRQKEVTNTITYYDKRQPDKMNGSC